MNKLLIAAGVLGLGALAYGASKTSAEPGGPVPPKPGDGPVPPKGTGGEAPWMPEPFEQYNYGSDPMAGAFAPKLYTIDFTAFGNGTIRWRVWEAKHNVGEKLTEEKKDAYKIGAGIEDVLDDARVAAEAFVDSLLKPKGLLPLPPKPMPLPPMDASSGPPSPPIVRHGLSLSGRQIKVLDVVDWIAWAEPYLRTRVKKTGRYDLVRGLLAETFPELVWYDAGTPGAKLLEFKVGNQWLLKLIHAADNAYFRPARKGKAWPVASADDPAPFERAAAELVGKKAPSATARVWPFRGHYVAVDPFPGGGWGWSAWRRGKSDAPPDLEGTAETQRLATDAAKEAIKMAS